MTRTTYTKLALLLMAAVALVLSGCGGDDNGGLSATDQARIQAAEDAAKMAQEKADAAEMKAAEAEQKLADMEAATGGDGDMGSVGLADLYEDLAGEAIEMDLAGRLPEEGPVSTSDLKDAIRETAEAYGLAEDAADKAIAYIESKHATYEVLQRGAIDDIIMALHEMDFLAATRGSAAMVLKGDEGEKGDTGAADDDTIAQIRKDIMDLIPDAVLPPMVEDAKVIQTGGLSMMASDYDNDMLSGMKKQTGSTAKKGTYTAMAGTGWGDLNALQAGGDGASVFGSWLEYSHWGVVMAENGDMGTFSLGMPTGANPAPQDASKTKASWTGLMTGAWKGSAVPGTVQGTAGDSIVEGDRKYETVRGDAVINVTFTSTGTGYKSSAMLSINNLVQSNGSKLGNYSPGEIDLVTGDNVAVGGSSPANPMGYNQVWTGMPIAKGDFGRKSITTDTAGALISPADNRDSANAMNYLAGRFYDMDGDEVGGVFMENGQVHGVTATGMALTAGENSADGILVGAFGAARVTPITP